MSESTMVNPSDRPSDEYRIQLNAWHHSFGTNQLTHALAERDALRATITTLQEQNKSLVEGLEEAVKALELCRDKISDLHDSQCDYIKSGRRNWGRREPCSCGASTRTGIISHALATLKPLISEVKS